MSTDVQTKVGTFIWHENNSTDAEKAKSFYTELLGWQTEAWSGEMDYTLIKVGDKGHGGFMAAQGETPSHWLGHVLVEDTDETARRAEAAGGRVLIIAKPPAAKIFPSVCSLMTETNPPALGLKASAEPLMGSIRASRSRGL